MRFLASSYIFFLLLPAPECKASTLFPVGIETGWRPEDFIQIDRLGNQGTPSGNGTVDYLFFVSKREVSNEQYALFLNEAAKTTQASSFLMSNVSSSFKITRSGTSGNFTYTVAAGYNNAAVNGVSPAAAFMYCNWLANFSNDKSLNTGSYNVLFDGQGRFTNRNANASIFILNREETLKAMYFDGANNIWTTTWSNPNNLENADYLPIEFVEHSKDGGYLVGDQVKLFYTSSNGGSPISLQNAENFLYPGTSAYNNSNWTGYTQNNMADVGFRVATTLSNVPEPSPSHLLSFAVSAALIHARYFKKR